MLHNFYFSPSGTTKATVDMLTKALGLAEVSNHDITLTAEALTIGNPDDVVIFAAPVYAGRIPPIAAERIRQTVGKGQKAVVIVVYGNRDYDDALLELCDIAKTQGFEIIACGAFIGQHCIFPKVATNRPDEADRTIIHQFADIVKQQLQTGALADTGRVKGRRPYKKPARVPLHPKVDREKCNECGTCATQCPTGAINITSPQATDTSKCITCCRCINVCPKGARKLGGLLYKIAGWKFVKDNSRRLDPEIFV